MVNRHDERLYIQSAYALPDKEKVDQEQASLLNVNDGFRKLIIVGDRYHSGYNEEGILMMSLSDFLLGKENRIDGLEENIKGGRTAGVNRVNS